MSEKRKLGAPGGARLFTAGDINTSLHGWRPSGPSFVQPRGWAAIHIINQRFRDGCRVDLYDQYMIVENPGAIVVCLAGDRIGLVQNFRMTAERLFDGRAEYIRRLEEEKRWVELVATFGEWHWELPRGLPPSDMARGGEDLSSFILNVAKLEALEEAGLTLVNTRQAGRLNANTTFFPHAQYVVVGEIVGRGQAVPEDLEMIGALRLFAKEEVRQLIDQNELTDGLTLAALAVVGYHF